MDSSVADDSNGDLALLGGDLALGKHSAYLANFGTTAIPKILEEEKGAKCEKSATNKKVDSSDEAFSSSLRADLSAWQSTQTKTQPLESTFENSAADTQKVDFSDEAQNISQPAKDSRISKETSANAERCPLFCDEKCGLQGKSQGSYLSGSDRSDFSQLPHLSRKTESTSKKTITQEAYTYLISSSGGDGRAMLNLLEVLALSDHITLEDVKSLRPVSLNDGTSEASTHYNLASALIKSIPMVVILMQVSTT